MNNEFRKLVKSTSFFGGAQFIQIITGIIRVKYIAFLMGPSGVGLYSILLNTSGIITNFLSSGINTSAVKEISEAREGSGRRDKSFVIKSFVRLAFLSGLSGVLLTFIFSPILSRFLFNSNSKTEFFIIIAISVLFNQLNACNLAILQGLQKINFLIISSIFSNISSLLFSLPIYFFFKAEGVAISILLVSIIFYITSLYFVKKLNQIKSSDSEREIISESWRIFKNGTIIGIASFFGILSPYLIRLFIGHFGTINQVGLFDAGYILVNGYVGIIFTIMVSNYYPELVKRFVSNADAFSFINQQIEFTSFLVTPIILILLVFGNQIISLLYTSEFIEIRNLVNLMSVAIFFKSISWPIAYILIAKNDNKKYFILELIINVINVVTAFLLYKLYGLLGIGISFFITYLTYFFLLAIISVRSYQFTLSSVASQNILVQIVIISVIYFCINKTNSLMFTLVELFVFIFSIYFSFRAISRRWHGI